MGTEVRSEVERRGRFRRKRARGWTVVAALLGILGANEVVLRTASLFRPPLTLDIGPSTGTYLRGFTESWEYPPVTARFAGRRASVELPLVVLNGDEATFSVRYARLWGTPTRAHFLASGTPLLSFATRPSVLTLDEWSRRGRVGSPFREFRLRRARTDSFPSGPVQIELVVENAAGSAYALAVDWIRVEGVRWGIPFRVYQPRLLVSGLFLVALAAGFGTGGALVAAGSLSAALGLWAALDPLAVAHVSTRVAWPGLLLALAFVGVLRRRPGGRWTVLIFLAGYLLKGAGLFHPAFFYPDVRTHRRYLLAFTEVRGSVVERGSKAQEQAGIAYPVRIAGKSYAFPYSPLFYAPFSVLPREPEAIDGAMKHVALAAAAAQVVAVFWIGELLFGSTAAVACSLLAALLPPLYSRLLLGMWPTVVAHLLDVLAIGAAAFLALRRESVFRLGGFACVSFLSLLAYVGSLFHLGAFVVCFCWMERRLAPRVLPVFGGLLVLTVSMLYGSFVVTFLREIVPSLWGQSTRAGVDPVRGLVLAAGRIPLFYGYVYPVLAVVGGGMVVRRGSRTAVRITMAYGLAVVMLVLLRGLGLGLFQDLKEILFAGPLVALTAGAFVSFLIERGRASRAVAALLVVALAAFGLSKYVEYVAPWVALVGG